MILNDEEIRYPKKGDKFFDNKGKHEEIAWLHKTFQELGSYADGYQIGAIKLLDTAILDSKNRDYLIYPIVFLIRHYLELRLKELLQGLNYCSIQTKEFSQHHRILELWTEFKKGYSAFGEQTNDESFKAIDSLIKELSNIDPISMAFRYPSDKNGNKIQKLDYVNLVTLKETFIRICFVFDGAAMQIAHYVEITEEMMSDAYGEYLYQ